jgi:hypothetical protein
MQIRTMRLVLGILFLILGCAIFARHWLFPEFAAGFDSLRMRIGGVFALVFAGVNLARWYAASRFMKTSQTAVRYPLQPDPSAAPQVEPIPEFDFMKQSEEAKVEGQGDAERKQ